MTSEVIWLSAAALRYLHDDGVLRYGGSMGMRDEALFLSALDSPKNLLAYGGAVDLFDLAACYAEKLARNHAFVDGNKRIAMIAALLFLSENGVLLRQSDQAQAVAEIEHLATSQSSAADYAAYLRTCEV